MEVHSQTAPYVSFMGEILPNHAFVNLSLVGNANDGSDSIQCHTDLATCCYQDRGDWRPPGSDARLPFTGEGGDIYQQLFARAVDLRRRNNANMPSGLYRCDIPTNAVHDDSDHSVSQSMLDCMPVEVRNNIIIMCVYKLVVDYTNT